MNIFRLRATAAESVMTVQAMAAPVATDALLDAFTYGVEIECWQAYL